MKEMYNLLIVDDEINVVRGLAEDIEWEKLEIENVFQANSGRKALEILEKNRIDVVLADIRMPNLNGLDLTVKINQKWPLARVILISGYDEFNYAQKAIDLKVYSYLTKPTAYEEIMEVVKNAIEDRNQELSRINSVEIARKKLEDAIPVMQERYLSSWIIQGTIDPLKEMEHWKSYRLDLNNEEPGILMMISFDYNRNQIEEKSIYELALEELVKNILLKNKNGIFFKDGEYNLLILMQDSQIVLEEYLQYISELANTFQKTVQDKLEFLPSILWSEIEPLNCMHQAYEKLLNRLHRSLIWENGIIMGPETIIEDIDLINLNNVVNYTSFNLLIESLKKKEAIKSIKEMFEKLEANEKVTYEILLEIYFTISAIIIRNSNKREISLEEWADEFKEVFYSFERINTFKELKDWCLKVIAKYMDYMANKDRTQTNQLIEKAKKFIINNLAGELSLDSIANHVYIHPNYLSRLFKDQEGISISEYIIKKKVEKARRLLQNPGIKIYHVAEEVGYRSVSHFCRIFKRETGVSPKKYQSI